MTSLDRRSFLRGAGALSAATAVGGVPALLTPVDAALARRQEAAPAWNRAPCRYCGVGCGLIIGIENGRAVAVKGDPDSPVSRGLACAKGYYSVQGLIGKDRITRPQVRQGGGSRVETSMAEAYDTVARQIRDSIRRSGKDSIAIYGSGDWTVVDAYLAGKLAKGALGTNNIATGADLSGASTIAGSAATFGLDGNIGCYDDVDHADVFVLWDVNLAETDPVFFSRMLDRKRINPAVRIVDLATRTTRTSYAADHSLLHSPHAGLAIANAICQEIVARKWVHSAFIDRHVAFRRGRTGIGYGLTDEEVLLDDGTAVSWGDYVSFLDDYEPGRVEDLAGLSASSIRWLASLYGDPQRKVMTIWGQEVNQDVRGTWMNNLLFNIHLLVGKVASPGNGPFFTTGQPNSGGSLAAAGAQARGLPRGQVTSEADRQRAADIWGVPVETVPREPGPSVLGLFRRIERGDIGLLWILSADPLMTLPNLDRYHQALARNNTFVVVSAAYPTPTTDVADVILPSALWFEQEGIYLDVERRAQYFDRLVAPPGSATGDAVQIIEVARRLGYEKLFPYEANRYVEQVWAEYGRFHTDDASALPALANLRSGAGALWPNVAGRETLWRYNSATDPAASGDKEEPDFYGHPDHRAWIWLRPYEPPAETPDQAYPYWLTTGVVLEHSGDGSLTQRIPTLHRALPHSYVEMNREDARQLGIRNREMIRLVSRRGSVEGQVRIDYRSQPPRGHVFVPNFDESLPVNRLTQDGACPLSGQPHTTTCAVRVERLQVQAKP